jgi:hypothetical protein
MCVYILSSHVAKVLLHTHATLKKMEISPMYKNCYFPLYGEGVSCLHSYNSACVSFFKVIQIQLSYRLVVLSYKNRGETTLLDLIFFLLSLSQNHVHSILFFLFLFRLALLETGITSGMEVSVLTGTAGAGMAGVMIPCTVRCRVEKGLNMGPKNCGNCSMYIICIKAETTTTAKVRSSKPIGTSGILCIKSRRAIPMGPVWSCTKK